jgi:hypothetical protein
LLVAFALLAIFSILDLSDFSAEVKNKALLVLLMVSEVLDFFLTDEVVLPSAVLLVDQCLAPQKDAVAGHAVELIQDDDVARNQPVRGNCLKSNIAVVD